VQRPLFVEIDVGGGFQKEQHQDRNEERHEPPTPFPQNNPT
jgi:hypothetical protein